jgi:hypothetical protein
MLIGANTIDGWDEMSSSVFNQEYTSIDMSSKALFISNHIIR